MRGKQVEDSMPLTAYSTKLRPETKELLGALVTVGNMDGQRELIEEMLELYEERYPPQVEKARALIKFIGKPQEEPRRLAALPPIEPQGTVTIEDIKGVLTQASFGGFTVVHQTAGYYRVIDYTGRAVGYGDAQRMVDIINKKAGEYGDDTADGR